MDSNDNKGKKPTAATAPAQEPKAPSTVWDALLDIQTSMHAPKDRTAYDFAGKTYPYRTLAGILEAVKPFLIKHGCTILFNDKVETVLGQIYIVSVATLRDSQGGTVEIPGYAREDLNVTGKRACQVTGSCSTYARKYALNALFALDDALADPVSDPDATVQTISGTMSAEEAEAQEQEELRRAEEAGAAAKKAAGVNPDTDKAATGQQANAGVQPAAQGKPARQDASKGQPSAKTGGGQPAATPAQAQPAPAVSDANAKNRLNKSNLQWAKMVGQVRVIQVPNKEIRQKLTMSGWVISDEDFAQLMIQAGKGLNEKHPEWVSVVAKVAKHEAPNDQIRPLLLKCGWALTDEDYVELMIQAGRG